MVNTDNARVKKRANMAQQPTIIHYDNGTTLIARADGSTWFGLSKYYINHVRGKE
jgi:hypothetical protein